MLLPSPAVRAALRLDTPAKRFAWAAEQLHAALFPSPAIVADPILGIPAKAANRGIALNPANPVLAPIVAEYMNAGTKANNPTFFQSNLNLPLDLVQLKRGVPLLFCVGQLSTDAYQPYVGTIVAGEPIPDNSVMKTFEQYLVEQLSIMITTTPNVSFDYSSLKVDIVNWYTTDYLLTAIPSLVINAALNRTGQVGTNRYGDITGIYTV